MTAVDATTMLHQPDDSFFNFPNTTWDGVPLVQLGSEAVYFSLYTADSAQSVYTGQSIEVQNVNDPTALSFNYPPASDKRMRNGIFTIYAAEGATAATEQYFTLVIDTIDIFDPDRGVDPVLVRILTTNAGSLSLNRTALRMFGDRVQFNSLLCNASNGTCSGDGLDDNKIGFISTPDIAHSLLRGMTYTNLRPNLMDNITITIFDGLGGDCLPAVPVRTVQNGCYESSVTMQVQVQEIYFTYASNSFNNSSSQLAIKLQYTALALVVILLVLALKCCFLDQRYDMFHSCA